MMKKFLLLFVISITHSVVGQESEFKTMRGGLVFFTKPNQHNVHAHAKRLAHTHFITKILRYSTATVAAGAGCYMAYTLYEYLKKPHIPEIGDAPLNNVELTQQLKELKTSCKPSLIRSFAPQICVTFAPVVIKKIFQELPIEEYVEHKTRLWHTCAELVRYAHDYDSYMQHEERKGHVSEWMIPVAYKNLVEDLEHITGYMHHKASTLTVAEKRKNAYHVAHLFFVASSAFCSQIAKVGVSYAGHEKLAAQVEQFKDEIEKFISTFAKIEQDEQTFPVE